MLQIISGRFFTDKGLVREQPTKAVLYSNILLFGRTETAAGKLEQVRYANSKVYSYVYEYTNRYQRVSENDPLLLANSDQAVDQFRAICCLWFRGIFHPNQAYVESIINRDVRFADHYFQIQTDTPNRNEDFNSFLTKLLALPRKKFNVVITCCQTFCDSIEAISDNFDVAYSLLIYALEALNTASDDEYKPTWADYDDSQRRKLDAVLNTVEKGAADSIKSILLNNSHLKLTKRFSDFISRQLGPEFFENESANRLWPIRKSDLNRLLRNLYRTRSGFVHELQRPLENIKQHVFERNLETIRYQHDVYLSYSGLARLTRHVLISFVQSSLEIEPEVFDWRSELPSIMHAEMSPEYWIWKTEHFISKYAKHKFSGVSCYFLDWLTKRGAGLIDLRPLMMSIKSLLPKAPKEYIPSLIAMHWLWNVVLDPVLADEGWTDLVQTTLDKDNKCRIEYLTVVVLICELKLSFDAKSREEAYRIYLTTRYQNLEVSLPPILESAILLYVANLYLDGNLPGEFQRLLNEALADMGGTSHQPLLRSHLASQTPINISLLLGQQAHEPPSEYQI